MPRRQTPEQIVLKFREAERLAGEGATTVEAAKQIDGYTRKSLAIVVDHSIDADDTVTAL